MLSRAAAQGKAPKQTLQLHPATDRCNGNGYNKEAALLEVQPQEAKVADLQQRLQAAAQEMKLLQDVADHLQQAWIKECSKREQAEQASKVRVEDMERELEAVKRESQELQERSSATDQGLRQELHASQQELQAARQGSQEQRDRAEVMYKELNQNLQGQITKLQMENYRLRLQGCK